MELNIGRHEVVHWFKEFALLPERYAFFAAFSMVCSFTISLFRAQCAEMIARNMCSHCSERSAILLKCKTDVGIEAAKVAQRKLADKAVGRLPPTEASTLQQQQGFVPFTGL